MIKRRDVHNLLKPTELRFKYQQNKVDVAPVPKQSTSLFKKIQQYVKRSLSPVNTQPTINNDKLPNLQIKNIQKITNEMFIIGNDHKLSIIWISIDESSGTQMKAESVCELYTNYSIKRIVYEKIRHNLVICGQKNFQVYKFSQKKKVLLKQSSYFTQKNIKFVEIFKQDCLVIFYNDDCTIYNIESHDIIPKNTLQYSQLSEIKYVLFSVPKIVDKCVNLFYYDKEQLKKNVKEHDYISLYKSQLYEIDNQCYMTQIFEIYKIPRKYFQGIDLINYDKQTILINLKQQILVLKRHYPIDSGTINYKMQNSFLYYLQNRNLLHICQNRIEVHQLNVFKNSIEIKPCDYINFKQPKQSRFFKCFPLQNNNFILFFLPKVNKNHNSIKYWVTITVKQQIKNKLQALLHSKLKQLKSDQEKILSSHDLQDIQQTAKKMGLEKKQIFLELWVHSPIKKTHAQYDILLRTENYKLISHQIKRSLKKQAIKFTEAERIEKTCFSILWKQIKKHPSIINISHYLKSHMILRKYNIQKNLEASRMSRKQKLIEMRESQQKKQQKNSVHRLQSIPKQIKQIQRGFQLTIQQYTEIRKRNIKKYMILLMKEINNNQNLEILHQYIITFKLTLRIIYKEFITQIIESLKQKVYDLLEKYPEILPFKRLYCSYLGLWDDIRPYEWQNNIFFQNFQNVDNIDILNEMMKTDKFKWNFLVKHDFIKIKKNEFQKYFVKFRQAQVFYVFLDRLFLTLKDNHENLIKIVKKVQQSYMLPAHIQNKIFLYWQLYKFFSSQQQKKIPDYNINFQELLALEEQRIYSLIFHNKKNCKHLVLDNIKKIYEAVFNYEEDPDKFFNESILKYFQADFSTLSDLKYLLNRINNQKEQFHEKNINFYKVLVEAALYKLQWCQNEQIPIHEILIYFENIPLQNQQIEKLKLVETIIEIQHTNDNIFSKLNLNINLKTFFNEPSNVIRKLIQNFIGTEQCTSITLQKVSYYQVSFYQIFQFLKQMRDRLFKNVISNQQIMEYLISFIMNYDDLIRDLEKIIYDEKFNSLFNIEITKILEKTVEQKIQKAFQTQSIFLQHKQYIQSILDLLKVNSPKKLQLESHLKLGLLLSVLDNPPRAPLSVSSRYFEEILLHEKINKIKQLDINLIYEYLINMGMKQKKNNLYEILIKKYLSECQWQDSIKYTKLWNMQDQKIIFSALVAMKVAEYLPKQSKQKMVDIIIIHFYKRNQLLVFIKKIMDTVDSQHRKRLINSIVKQNYIYPEEFYQKNWLLSSEFKKINYDHNIQKIVEYYQQSIRIIHHFQNNQYYYLYYRLLLCQPLVAYQFHRANTQLFDYEKLKLFYNELVNCTLFVSLEIISFFYKSLFCIFLDQYLCKQFGDSLKIEFFFDSLENIEIKHKNLILQIHDTMHHDKKELEKFEMLLYFKKLYQRRKKYRDNQKMSLDVQDDRQEQLDFIKDIRIQDEGRKKKKPLIMKKKSFQPIELIQSNNIFDQFSYLNFGSIKNHVYSTIKNSNNSNFFGTISLNYLGNNNIEQNHLKYSSKDLKINSQINQNKRNINILDVNFSPYASLKNSRKSYSNQNTPNGLIDHQQIVLSKQKSLIQYSRNNYRKLIDQPYLQLQNNEQEELTLIKEIKEDSKLQNSKGEDINNQCIQNCQQVDKQKIFTQQLSSQNKKCIAQENIYKSKIELISSQQQQNSYKNNLKNQQKMEQNVRKSFIKQNVDRNQDSNSPVNIQISNKKNNTSSKQFYSFYPESFQKIGKENQLIQTKKSLTKYQIQKYFQQQGELSNFGEEILQNSTSTMPIIGLYQQDLVLQKDINEKVDQILKIMRHQNFQAQLKDFLNINYNYQILILKKVVVKLYQIYNFNQIINIVSKLTKISSKFQNIVKEQNLKIMTNAVNTRIIFDFRTIFPPQMLYFTAQVDINDVESHNKALFKYLKPTLIKILTNVNCFMVAKVMFLCFGYNKIYEYRVQYYYLQGLIKNYVQRQQNQNQQKMCIQKIILLLQKLPVSMTVKRIQKIINHLINQKSNKKLLKNLLNKIKQSFDKKKSSSDNHKNQKQLLECINILNKYLQIQI